MKKATTSAVSPTSAVSAKSSPVKKTPAKRASSSSAKDPKNAVPAPSDTAPPAKAPPPAPAKATIPPPVKAPAPAPAKAAVDAPAAPAAAKPKAATTTVTAGIDVGFGNQLYIRGEGPGLSWDKGVLMDCASPDRWTWSSSSVSRPFAFKVLINDSQWASGDDFVAAVGVDNVISPVF